MINSPFFTSNSLPYLVEGTLVIKYLNEYFLFFPYFKESDLLILRTALKKKNLVSNLLEIFFFDSDGFNEFAALLEFCKKVRLGEEFFGFTRLFFSSS